MKKMMEMWIKDLLLITYFISTSGFYVQPEVVTFGDTPESGVVCEGCSLELGCTILKQRTSADLPQPEIHWQFNETAITEVLGGAPVIMDPIHNETHLTVQLRIDSALLAHSGRYRCLAVDGMDGDVCTGGYVSHSCISTNTLSSHAWIQVIGNVTRTQVIELPVFSSVLLECGSRMIRDRDDQIRIIWNKNEREIDNSENVVALSNGNLMVYTDDHSQDRTSYDCFVLLDNVAVHYQSYQLISSQFNGNRTTLSVTASQPHLTYSGSVAELTCSVINIDSNHPLNVSWIKQSPSPSLRTLGVLYSLYGHILTLEEVRLEDGGYYCCQIEGWDEECIELNVIEQESYFHTPSQQSINFRNSGTHFINLMCPIQRSYSPILWFWNGNVLVNSTENFFIRSSTDAGILYGVYQCCVGCLNYPMQGVQDGDIATVTRVMPHGISNPPGAIRLQELPLPNSSLSTAISMEWVEPRYTGNISISGYRVHVINMNFFPQESNLKIFFSPYIITGMVVYVHESSIGDLSDGIFKLVVVNSTCQYEVLFPPIVSLSCDMGRPHLSWEFNVADNEPSYGFTSIYGEAKAYFLDGGCLDEGRNVIYEIPYLVEHNNPYTFDGGMVFEVGTLCIASVANTAAMAERKRDRLFCYDPANILYSDFISCSVKASVGFTSIMYSVSESVGGVNICVRAEGYGFTVNITVIPITASVDDYESIEFTELDFSASSSSLVCFNLTIYDDNKVESGETLQLMLTSITPNVELQNDTSTIMIIDNDNVRIGIQPDILSVLESIENVQVCIDLVGTLEKDITVTITPTTVTPTTTETIGEFGTEIHISPLDASSHYCIDVSINDNNILEDNKTLYLDLSSRDEGVIFTSSSTLIIIYDDDNVTVQFSMSEYSVRESDEMLEICVEMTGVLGKYAALTVMTIDGTAIAWKDFVPVRKDIVFYPYSDTPIQCFTMTILDDTNMNSLDRRLRLTLSSNISRVSILSNVTVVIVGEGSPTSRIVAISTSLGILMALLVVGILLIAGLITANMVLARKRRRTAESHAIVDRLWRSERNEYTITPCKDDPVSLITFNTIAKPFHNSDDCLDSKSVILALNLKDCGITESKMFFDAAPKNSSTSTIVLDSDSPAHLPQSQLLDGVGRVRNFSEESAGYIDMQRSRRESASELGSMPVLESETFSPLLSPPLQDNRMTLETIQAELNQRLCQLSSEDSSILHASNPCFEQGSDSIGNSKRNDDFGSSRQVSTSPMISKNDDQDSGLPYGLYHDSGYPEDYYSSYPPNNTDNPHSSDSLCHTIPVPDNNFIDHSMIDSGCPLQDASGRFMSSHDQEKSVIMKTDDQTTSKNTGMRCMSLSTEV